MVYPIEAAYLLVAAREHAVVFILFFVHLFFSIDFWRDVNEW